MSEEGCHGVSVDMRWTRGGGVKGFMIIMMNEGCVAQAYHVSPTSTVQIKLHCRLGCPVDIWAFISIHERRLGVNFFVWTGSIYGSRKHIYETYMRQTHLYSQPIVMSKIRGTEIHTNVFSCLSVSSHSRFFNGKEAVSSFSKEK